MKINTGFIFLFFCTVCNAQDSATVKFYDFITQGSVVMYFDNRYNFTGAACARYKRYVKLDEAGNFSGFFNDYENDILLGNGEYNNGIKEGVFETFYANGNIKSRGNFKNNKPSGYWNYFYADGKTEKQLLFNMADTFLLEYFDNDGHHLINAGNGHFKGFVGVATDAYYSTVAIAEGKIANGKPDGVWTSRIGGRPFYTEKFDKGVFIAGKAPKNLAKDKEDYFDFSCLDILYQPGYIYRLEEFNIEKCDPGYVKHLNQIKNTKANGKAIPYSDFAGIQSYIQDAVQNVIASDVRNGNLGDYQAGENLFKLSFKISNKETPVDFKRLTSWGDQFFNPVTNALSMHLKMPPATEVIYLIITITKDASNYLTSRFYFSNE